MLEPITANLKRTERDVLAAFAARDEKQNKTLRRATVVLLGAVGVLVAITWPVSPGLWMIAVPLMIVGMLLLPANTRSQAVQAWKGTAPGVREVTLTLTDAGLRWHNEKYEREQPWSAIREWKETPELIVVLDKTGGVEVWRKDAFEPDDLQAVRVRLDAAIPLEAEKPATVARKPRRWAKVVAWLVVMSAVVILYAYWRSMS